MVTSETSGGGRRSRGGGVGLNSYIAHRFEYVIAVGDRTQDMTFGQGVSSESLLRTASWQKSALALSVSPGGVTRGFLHKPQSLGCFGLSSDLLVG
jgi:hypothetical protein